MNEEKIAKLCIDCFEEEPRDIARCTVGQGNYVYIAEFANRKAVVRCSKEAGAYKDTVYWLERLAGLDIPVPRILGKGIYEEFEYLILSYLEGQDIGIVYQDLTAAEKLEIAREVVDIQNKVSALPMENIPEDWSWKTAFVEDILLRAKDRIRSNGCHFDPEKAERLLKEAEKFEDYFTRIQPIAYLDDISTKNLLIHEGRLSGVIDIDWMGVGDKLTYVAMTHMALLNMGYDTDYVSFLLNEMHLSEAEKRAFHFYSLVYCVDFMGERGMRFMDKQVPVSSAIVAQMNEMYEKLWREYASMNHELDFRLARREDAADILSLYKSAIGSAFCVWNDYYPGEAEIAHDLETANLYVLTSADEIIGALSVVPENEMDDFPCWSQADRAREIARVVISEAHRGKGLAYEMVQSITPILLDAGCTSIHLSAVKSNIPACRTYQKAGFQTVGEAEMYGHSYFLMEKVIFPLQKENE